MMPLHNTNAAHSLADLQMQQSHQCAQPGLNLNLGNTLGNNIYQLPTGLGNNIQGLNNINLNNVI